MNTNEKRFLDFRATFPAYSQGSYLNHAAVSPLSLRVKKRMEDYWEQRSHLPVDVYPGLMETKTELKAMIASLINAPNPEQIALIPNTSIGLNMIATGMEWKENDRIILNTMEFPANIYPFLNLQKQGVIIDWVTPNNGRVRPEDIEQKITPKTKMIAISFVQFINGFTADLEAIGAICKQKDIWFVVDGIQGTGAVPVDVTASGIDSYVTGGQKWLMWPMGTGFLHMSPKLMEHLQPTFAGWLSVKDSWNLFDYNLEFLDTAEKLEAGTTNFMGMVIAHEVLGQFLELKIENIHQRILTLTDRLIQGFQELNLEMITPLEKTSRSGIVSIKVEEPQKLFDQLTEAEIHIALREGILRFSPHCANTMEDIDRVLDFLKKK